MPLIRTGRNFANATPTNSDLWLPVFGGEVITAFMENNLFRPLVYSKTIASGNTAKFPATWKIGAERHAAGAEMLGMDTSSREYTLTLDERPIVSHFELDDVDAAMAHFETRGEISNQCGYALAREDDKNCARLLVLASRFAQGNSTDFPGGGIDGNGGAVSTADLNSVTPTTTATATHAQAILNAIDRWVPYLDTLDVPEGDRYCAVFPNVWNAIRNLTSFNGQTAAVPLVGHRDIDTKNIQIQAGAGPKTYLYYKGVYIFKSNNIPRTNETSTGYGQYAADFSLTKGIMFIPSAIGHLTLMGITAETDRIVNRGVDFSVVKMLTGGGILRPYVACEIKSAA
jgi:hypothetical protein